jgi:hypothetical protein
MFIRARRGFGVGAGHPGHWKDGRKSVRLMCVIPGYRGVTTVCASDAVQLQSARLEATNKRITR